MKRILIAAVLILFSAQAWAQNFYAYGAWGFQSNFHIDNGQRDSATSGLFGGQPDESFITEEGGGKLQLGYRVLPRLAIEGGIYDLGKAEYFARRTVRPSPLIINVFTSHEEWTARGYNLAVLGFLPVGNGFSFFGKMGAVHAKTHFKRSSDLSGTPSEADATNSKWASNFGVGVSWDIPGKLPIGLRLEHERVGKIGDESTAGARNVDMTSFGVVIRF